MTAELTRDDDADELPPGTPLCGGALVIEACLGRGGVATVYRVRDADGRHLALKMMVTDRASDGDQRERFENEWRILHALRGLPYVVAVEHNGRHDDGRPLFTMDLLQAPTLADLLIDREVTVLRACRVIREVAHALDDLHTRGVIHRDIKPDNIVVEPDRVRLLDFGFAYSRGSDQVPRLAGLTGVEHRPGTLLYMAPEQADGEDPAPSFDIYALAVTLYEALVGHAPNSELPPVLMMAHKCRGGPQELSIEGRVHGLPRGLVKLVDEGLRRRPQDRVQSAGEFRDRLDAVIEELGDRDLPAGIQDRPEEAAGMLEEPEVTLPFLPAHLRAVAQAAATTEPASSREVRPAIGGGRGDTRRLGPEEVGAAFAAREGSPDVSPTEVESKSPKAVPSPSSLAEAPEPEPKAVPIVSTSAEEPPQPAPTTTSRRPWIVAVVVLLVLLVLSLWWGLNRGQSQGVVPSRDASAGDARPDPKIEPGPSTEPKPTAEPELPVPEPEPDQLTPEPELAEPEPPIPGPEPETKRRRPKGTKRKRPRPTPAVVEEPPCTDVAGDSRAAVRSKQWTRVLKLTKSSRCWEDEGLRTYLRAQAFSELRRYSECAALSSSSNPETKRMALSCATQIDQE
ncbi:MAG: protein kinase [Myxococcales bacterium]|nr:protein kinase [Myxococcales bacterium]